MKKENICNVERNIWDCLDSRVFVNIVNLTEMQVPEDVTPQRDATCLPHKHCAPGTVTAETPRPGKCRAFRTLSKCGD